MYATEELWFTEHDMQGTPWSNPESYKKWSASTFAAELGKYKTPTLVIAGENDFRVPYTQSLEFFNTLQREGVTSKLVVFPDEGHWVLKPANSARCLAFGQRRAIGLATRQHMLQLLQGGEPVFGQRECDA